MHPALRDTLRALPALYRQAMQPETRALAIAVGVVALLVAVGTNLLATLAALLCWLEWLCYRRWTLSTENPQMGLARAGVFTGLAVLSAAQGLGNLAWGLGAFTLMQAAMAFQASIRNRHRFLAEVGRASQHVSAQDLLDACAADRGLVETYLSGDETLEWPAQVALRRAALKLFRNRVPRSASESRIAM